MKSLAALSGFGLAFVCLAAWADDGIGKLSPYPLPADVEESLVQVANECDVLVLGETHGTQEVPAVVASLLAPLAKIGYRTLALEIPCDKQLAILDWATGATDKVPRFFAEPGADGRGNEQVLALMRRALRPPCSWKLICCDAPEDELTRQMQERLPADVEGSVAELAAKLSFDDVVALSVKRDATMAGNFAAERKKLPAENKVLAICGNMHSRTADHAPADSPIKPFWPSFAAVLKRDHPDWRIQSINVRAFSGEYFNGGKVNKIGERPLDKVTLRHTANADYGYELDLPKATAATFLKTPSN